MPSKKYKITFEFYTYDSFEESKKKGLIGLLKNLEYLGIVGSSRLFGIKDAADDFEEKQKWFFDGDGADRIEHIKVKEKKRYDLFFWNVKVKIKKFFRKKKRLEHTTMMEASK